MMDSNWLLVAGKSNSEMADSVREAVERDVASGRMPPNEETRVSELSTSLAKRGFTTSAGRMEVLRELCQLYGRGVTEMGIESHRPFIGPVIVAVKKVVRRIVFALLGPKFAHQREFNARVIRLLADLSNETRSESEPPLSK